MVVDLRWFDAWAASGVFSESARERGWPDYMAVEEFVSIQRPSLRDDPQEQKAQFGLRDAIYRAIDDGSLLPSVEGTRARGFRRVTSQDIDPASTNLNQAA